MFEEMIDDTLKNEEFMKELQNEKEEMENQQKQMKIEMNENVTVINDEQRMKLKQMKIINNLKIFVRLIIIKCKMNFQILKMISQQFQTIINKIINITIQMK